MKLLLTTIFLLSIQPSFGESYSYESDMDFDDQISIDSFKESIELNNADTVEKALSLVPKDFFENYVLVYRSRSLQDSSFEYPRVIAFGKSARFVLAFNGHKDQKGFNSIETIQFRENEQKWEFSEITFSGNGLPTFETNPTKCLECHQSPSRTDIDMRPNWEPYNFWPGVYGSVDDTIEPKLKKELQWSQDHGTNLHGVLARFVEDDFFLVDEQSQEQESLKYFEENIKTKSDSRYRFLGEFSTRDPLNLTKSLVRLNMFRVARLMKQNLGEHFPIYKYALFGLGSASYQSSRNLKFRCSEFYLSGEPLQLHLNYLGDLQVEPDQYLKPSNSYWRTDLAVALDIIFKPLGISTKDWSMDFKTNGRFAFQNRYGSPADSFEHLREAMLRVYGNEPASELSCDELEERSLNATQSFYDSGEMERLFEATASTPALPQKPLIQRCINCHVGYDDVLAPYIPFNNPMLLKAKLGETTYKRGSLLDEIKYRTGSHAKRNEQMPPAGQVDPELRREFIEYIESL